jgi:two-component system, response regulator PdtaR
MYSIALVCGTIRSPTTWSSRAFARGIADQMVDHQCPKLVVLIVEDECLIRMDAIDGLMAAGFEVLEAEGADEAIKILRSRSDISVVFTDIQMPGSMDGLRLAAVVRDRWPPIKIIATSGRAKIAKDQLPAEARFVAKPYDARQVAAVIGEMIATSG